MTKLKLLVYKLSHWEYYPFYIVYIPIYFVWMYYAIRARAVFIFNTLNPGLNNGQFLMDSKKAIYDHIPESYSPKSILFESRTKPDDVRRIIEEIGLVYPLMAKPDVGLRGIAVQKLNTYEDLKQYAEKINVPYLIQEFISYPNEVGIFYVRLPGSAQGQITGIVSKEFMKITGDSIHTIEQLIVKTPRYHFQLKTLRSEYGSILDNILPDQESIDLVPYGNHNRGTKFIDASHMITKALRESINEVCLQINGFYYGRLDIRYDSFEALEKGKRFSIIEINGAISEPTHIYDPKHSIFFAWKEITRHCRLMYKICSINHKKGIAYYSFKEGINLLGRHLRYMKLLKQFIANWF